MPRATRLQRSEQLPNRTPPPETAGVSLCPGPSDGAVLRTRCSTPPTCGGPSPASRTRSSSATTAPTTSVLVGLYTRGVALARRIAAAITSFEGVEVPTGTLDVAFYRDDIGLRPVAPLGPTEVPDVTDRIVVLVDDVLFTGRTARAALEALLELGPAPCGAARGARRPRPSRAADPRRLRRQEPAHEDRRGRARPARPRSTAPATASRSGVRRSDAMKHLLVDRRSRVDDGPAGGRRRRRPVRARDRGDARPHRLVRRGARAATSRRSRRCAARPSCRSSTRTRPAPGSRSRPRRSDCRPTR